MSQYETDLTALIDEAAVAPGQQLLNSNPGGRGHSFPVKAHIDLDDVCRVCGVRFGDERERPRRCTFPPSVDA